MRKYKGITLISLVITVVILIILAGIGIYAVLGNNGILNKAKEAKDETLKQAATEKMNLKITNIQIDTYGKEQRMPTLQEFSDGLCEDNEIQYVELQSKKVGSLSKLEVGNASSIFTKLKEYPYEFEINSSLQLASIDGIQVSTSDTVTISKEEYESILTRIDKLEKQSTNGKIFIDTNDVIDTLAASTDWSTNSYSYTATKDCAVVGSIGAVDGGAMTIFINSILVGYVRHYQGLGYGPINYYLKEGDTIEFKNIGSSTCATIKVYGLK